MKKNYLILIFITLLEFRTYHSQLSSEINVENNDEGCEEFFKKYAHPNSCCDYPLREIPNVVQEKCKEFCSDLKDGSARGCCLIDCNYRKTGVYANGKFNEKSLMQLYENYLNEHGGGKYDQWAEIVEKSIDECRTLVETTEDVYACDVPTYVMDIMDCVDHLNFLNCPNYRLQDFKCIGLKIFVVTQRECGKMINGTFIVDHKFFKMSSNKSDK